jgi:hypothetical protein
MCLVSSKENIMPYFYADTAEALEDVAVSASEALGAFVSFQAMFLVGYFAFSRVRVPRE